MLASVVVPVVVDVVLVLDLGDASASPATRAGAVRVVAPATSVLEISLYLASKLKSMATGGKDAAVGDVVGVSVGDRVGVSVGERDGAMVGDTLGFADGAMVGDTVGDDVGDEVSTHL